jgi:kynurenine formamidase
VVAAASDVRDGHTVSLAAPIESRASADNPDPAVQSLGPWDAAEARVGLHPAALELLAERRIAVLGSDGNNDTAPSAVEGVDFPVHVLAINAMGMYLLDYLDLDALAERCEAKHRASFLCVVAPLRLREGTGSPVNPIAIF